MEIFRSRISNKGGFRPRALRAAMFWEGDAMTSPAWRKHFDTRLQWVANETLAQLEACLNHENGSFEAMFERRGARIKFAWDAGAETLSVLLPSGAFGAQGKDWNLDARISFPGGNGLFEEIAAEIEEHTG